MSAIEKRNLPLGSSRRFQGTTEFDVPLWESDQFICVPSLGSVLPGWILITPRRPVLNMALLNAAEAAELKSIFPLARQRVESAFGETCAFEHGAQKIGSLTGCGVDQAHLHIVPISSQALLKETAGSTDWQAHPFKFPWELELGEREYLWLSGRAQAYVSYPKASVSQYFRRAIASICGVSNKWDYREYSFLDNVRETARSFSSAAEALRSRAA